MRALELGARSAELPPAVSVLSGLPSLDLSRSLDLTTAGCGPLAALTGLRELALHDTRVMEVPASIQALTGLTRLSLNSFVRSWHGLRHLRALALQLLKDESEPAELPQALRSELAAQLAAGLAITYFRR